MWRKRHTHDVLSAKSEVLTRGGERDRYLPRTHPQYLLDKDGDGKVFIDQSYPLGTNAISFINHFKGVRTAQGKLVGQTFELVPGGQVRASRNIEKGEELLSDYGPDFYFDPEGSVQVGSLVQAQIWLDVESEGQPTSPEGVAKRLHFPVPQNVRPPLRPQRSTLPPSQNGFRNNYFSGSYQD